MHLYTKYTRNRQLSQNNKFQKMENPNPKENVVLRKQGQDKTAA